jgi:hypothetical protein
MPSTSKLDSTVKNRPPHGVGFLHTCVAVDRQNQTEQGVEKIEVYGLSHRPLTLATDYRSGSQSTHPWTRHKINLR